MNVLQPTKWVDLYGDYLFNYASMRVNDQEICSDIIQDTFLSALKAKDSFKGESTEKTWLTSILKNKIIDHYRKEKKAFAHLEEEDNEDMSVFFQNKGESNYGWQKNQVPQSWQINSLDSILSKELKATLRLCLKKLSHFQQCLLLEKYFEEKSSENICKELSISKSNYWTTMHRINLQLRKCIETALSK